MKNLKLLQVLALFTITLFWVACEKDNVADNESTIDNVDVLKTLRSLNPEKADIYEMRMAENPALRPLNTKSSFSYIDRLCAGETYSGTATTEGLFNAANWGFYYFSGNAGDVVTIRVARTGNCNMDPAFSLFFGTTNSTTGVTFEDGGPDMTFLKFQDDDFVSSCPGCFSDPELVNYVLPFSGTYTLGVYDFFACGPDPLTYDLTIEGVLCTIVIEGCDTGVNDQTLPGGQTMSDAIADCKANAPNHGQFVRCIAALTNQWVRDGYISGDDKDAIMQCAAESNNEVSGN